MTNVPLPQSNIGFSASSGEKRKRWHQDIPWLEFPDGEWLQLRFIGPVYQIAQSWLTTKKSRKKFPVLCSGFDPVTTRYDYEKSPILKDFDPFNSEVPEIKALSPKRSGLGHVIVRSLEQSMDPARPNLKPWRPLRIPVAVMHDLADLRGANIHKIQGKNYDADVTDPYYGRDINILYKSNAPSPTQKYNVQMLHHSPLTEVEMAYLEELYKWEEVVEYPSYEEVKMNLMQNGYYNLLAGHSEDPLAVASGSVGSVGMDSTLPQVPQPPPASVSPFAATTAPAPAPVTAAAPVSPTATSPYPPAPGTTTLQPSEAVAPPPTAAQVPQAPSTVAPPPGVITPETVGGSAKKKSRTTKKAKTQAVTQEPIATDKGDDVEIPFSQGSSQPVRLVEEAPAEAEKMYACRNKKVTQSDFEGIINKYSENVDRALPLITWESGDLEGVTVMNCFSNFNGDQKCVKCPLRRYCLKA